MTHQRYYVVGGEYADMSFTTPAPGTELETHGPFASERDAKLCWRDLTGKTVDNAMVRYFLKTADETGGKNYWVVGGEYANSSFTKLASGKELEVYGPFERAEALGFWRGLAAKSVDDALMRYDIRENYEAGETGRKLSDGEDRATAATATKAIAIAASVERVHRFLADGANWPRWAVHAVKAARASGSSLWEIETPQGPGRLTLKADAATGILDHTLVDGAGHSWTVPGRVVGAAAGAVFVFIFTKPEKLSESQFDSTMGHVDGELETLKRVLED